MTITEKPDNSYELVIVGGGIHGAGIAQACAAAGYKCLLVEKNDWAWATSSRSSKLLHGGLRYLQTGQLKLVRECLHERELLLRNARELAQINWFYLPVYQDSNYSPWKIFAGLSVYRMFTGLSNPHGKFRIVPRKNWSRLNGLCTKNLRTVFAYQDAQTDDRLLTQAVKNSAIELGCDAWQPAEMLSAQKNDVGWQVRININGNNQTVNCKALVNAAGPWVNEVISRCGSAKKLPVDLVQGTHLILQQQISKQCFYLEAKDHRAVFVLPWYNKTLVGTTEKTYQGDPANTEPTDQEIQYLLETVRSHFPAADLSIHTQFSGLRILPTSTQKAFLRSRETQLLDDQGFISLYGGKLTAYRATAGQVLQLVKKYLPARTPRADTRTLHLYHPCHSNES
jgi:glycerol-3-phosphate dehydrogenase